MKEDNFRPLGIVAVVCWVSLALLPWFLLTNREWWLTDSAVIFAIVVWLVVGVISGALAAATPKKGVPHGKNT